MLDRSRKFAVFCCGRAQAPGPLRPTVGTSSGSYIPEAADEKHDRGEAKICFTSAAARSQFSSWADMNSHNYDVMGGKTQTGRLVRNLARQATKDAKVNWNSSNCLVDFYNCQDTGAAVSMLRARTEETVRAIQQLRHGSCSASSSSGRALPTLAEPAPKARPAMPKAMPVKTETAPVASARQQPRLELHLYTLGVQFLGEGHPQ